MNPVDTSVKENETADVASVNSLPPVGGGNSSGTEGSCRWEAESSGRTTMSIECFVFGVGIGTEMAVWHSEWLAGWCRRDVWYAGWRRRWENIVVGQLGLACGSSGKKNLPNFFYARGLPGSLRQSVQILYQDVDGLGQWVRGLLRHLQHNVIRYIVP